MAVVSLLTSKPVLCFTSFILAIAICMQIAIRINGYTMTGLISVVLLKSMSMYLATSKGYQARHSIAEQITNDHNLCVNNANLTVSCQHTAFEALLGVFMPDFSDIVQNKPETLLAAFAAMNNEDRFNAPPYGTYYEQFEIGDIPVILIHSSPKLTQKKLFANGVIIHLHGGGYIIGSFRADHQYTSYLHLFTGLPVLAFDYKLAPQYPLQSGQLIEDGKQIILKYLHKHLSVPFRKMYVTGTSAGGGASLLLMHHFAKQGHFFGGVIPVSPWSDLRILPEIKSFREMDGIDPMLNYDAMRLFQVYALGCRGVDGQPTVDGEVAECIKQGLVALQEKEMNPATIDWSVWNRFDKEQQKEIKAMQVAFIVASHEILRDDSILMHQRLLNKVDAFVENQNIQLLQMQTNMHCLPLFVDVPEAMKWIYKISYLINKWNERM